MMTRLIASLQISSSPYVNVLLALAAFAVLASIVDLLVDKVVRRVASFTKSDVGDRVIDLVHLRGGGRVPPPGPADTTLAAPSPAA